MAYGEPHSAPERLGGTGPSSGEGLAWRGQAALVLLAVHVVLLLLPPLPPYWKGSVWDYALGYTAVALAVLEVARRPSGPIARWRGLTPARRVVLGYGTAAILLALGWSLLLLAPDLFGRFSREEGLWEPITLFLYLGAAALLLGAARSADDTAGAGPLWLVGTVFALAAAEELDYLGVFGMLLGRVEGEYVGSPHDLLLLLADGTAPPAVTMVVLLPVLGAAVFLRRRGGLRPSAFGALARPRLAVWLPSALALVALAVAEEARFLGVQLATPSPEELIEATGAVLLACFALEVAAESAIGTDRTGTPP